MITKEEMEKAGYKVRQTDWASWQATKEIQHMEHSFMLTVNGNSHNGGFAAWIEVVNNELPIRVSIRFRPSESMRISTLEGVFTQAFERMRQPLAWSKGDH